MLHFFSHHTILIISTLTAFVIAYVSIPSIIKVSEMKSLFAEPNERASHHKKTPTLGGVAIFAGFMLTILLFITPAKIPDLQYVVAASLIIFFVGIKDDILIIAPWFKLAGQALAALILVILGDVRFTHLHGFFGIFGINYITSSTISILFIVVLVNAYNLIDGIDGLCAGIGIVTAAAFGGWFAIVGRVEYALVAAALIGALMAFFRYNVFGGANKIFMGDTGSQLVGLVIAVLTIHFNEFNINPEYHFGISSAPSVSFGILMIPIFDTMRVMFIRFNIKRSVFQADRNHIHHRFLRVGFSHLQSTIILVSINIFFIAFSYYFQFVSIRRLLLILLLLGMIYSYIPSYLLERREKK